MSNALKLMAVGAGAALLACQTLPLPDASLQEAQMALAEARSEPLVARSAAAELDEAQRTLARAERVWADEGDEAEMRHLAYLASRRVAIARGVAARRDAEERLRAARLELERLRAQARDRSFGQAAGTPANPTTVRTGLRLEPSLDDEVAPLDGPQSSSGRPSSGHTSGGESFSLHAVGLAQATPLQGSQACDPAGSFDASAPDVSEADAAFIGALDAQRTARGAVVSLPGSLYASGTASLMPVAREPVEQIAGVLQRFPQRRLLIEAFTDATGPEALNLELSRQRAETFRQALAEHGVALARVEARGHGAAYPAADNATPAGRMRNERVEILLSDAQGRFPPR